MNKKDKIRNIVIVVLVIAIIILLVLILINIFKKEDKKKVTEGVYIVPGEIADPNMKKVTNRNYKKEKCVDNICVSNIVINCDKDYGKIDYTIKNKGKKKESGYLKITIGDYSSYIIYKDLGSGKSKNEYIFYNDYDLRKAKDYTIRKLTVDESVSTVG